VVVNAAAALYAADVVPDVAVGVDRARETLTSGAARRLRDAWVTRSRELAS
jgi:anthranilate phosphoribosyltransferase